MSTASMAFPTTPPSKLRQNTTTFSFNRPSTSSPLAHQSSSPIAEVQARRRSQFKSQSPSCSRIASSSSEIPNSSNRRINSKSSGRYLTPAQLSGTTNETPQVAFLRQRFKNKCAENAKKARQRDRDMRRWASSDTSSDGFDVEMGLSDNENGGDDDDPDAVLNDEIFRRIIANERRKAEHAYRLSYELDVGSSIDPDMMDVAEWEAELQHSSNSNSNTNGLADVDDDECPPEDLLDAVDDDELVALYEEFEREQQQQEQRQHQQYQQQQEDDQQWEALLDDPLEFDDPAAPCSSADQMES
ncbi:hypothetical protein SCHPADRAFT_855468 [Schizopora paradoxa]|uniref:Uncharacterized protein n=1 Tax=Schizopora paradoxa TaxID=27342 RepID=A0A0H2RHV4_9AGAM|nr:hypothetical protein SCHPADRAFT_855468 [Schizopora paradoxa]